MKYLHFILRLIQWLIYLIPYILLWLLKFPLAPIAVILFSTKDRKHLWKFLYLFETIDNDLGGDSGWLTHITGDRYSTWNRIKWLWRNGFNTFNFLILSIKLNVAEYNEWKYNQTDRNFWIFSDGSWQYRAHKKIPFINRYWTPFIGWGLFGPINGRCKFTCTIPRFEKY